MMNSRDNHYGIRAGLIGFVWLAFYSTLVNTDNINAFVGTVVLYLLPLSIDYIGQNPVMEKNINRRTFVLWSTFFISLFFIALALFLNNFEGFLIHSAVQHIISILGVFYVIMAFCDWSGYSSPEEMKNREQMREISRTNRIQHMEERIQHHKEYRKEISRKTGSESI